MASMEPALTAKIVILGAGGLVGARLCQRVVDKKTIAVSTTEQVVPPPPTPPPQQKKIFFFALFCVFFFL